MKTITRSLAGVFLLSLFLISCYPKQKILVRFPDGRPKIVRHFKRKDTLNEKLIAYYDNGKKEYVKYWHNDVGVKDKAKSWYKNGKVEEVFWEKLKDTVRTYNHADSSTIITGLSLMYKKDWYENGKTKFISYVKNGHVVFDRYNEQGVFEKEEILNAVRPDGYDSIKFTMYRHSIRASKPE